MEISDQLIVTATSGVSSLTFARPLKVKDKKIGLKAIYYPKFSEFNDYYLYLEDESTGKELRIKLAVSKFYTSSNDLVWLMWSNLWDYCERTGRKRPDIVEHDETSSYEPDLPSGHDYLIMNGTGLKVLTNPPKFSNTFNFTGSSRNIFELFNPGSFSQVTVPNATATNNSAVVDYHTIDYGADEKSQLVYVKCNIVDSTYVNSKKQQILDILNLSFENDFNEHIIDHPAFKKVVVDELFILSITVESFDGKRIDFNEHQPIVFKLIFKQ